MTHDIYTTINKSINKKTHELNENNKKLNTHVNKKINHKTKNKKSKKNYKLNKTKITNKKTLNIMYTNVDSLANKLNEIETYASYYDADLILIAEYLSKNSNTCNFNNIFNLNGFNCIESNKGRGVCIFS